MSLDFENFLSEFETRSRQLVQSYQKELKTLEEKIEKYRAWDEKFTRKFNLLVTEPLYLLVRGKLRIVQPWIFTKLGGYFAAILRDYDTHQHTKNNPFILDSINLCTFDNLRDGVENGYFCIDITEFEYLEQFCLNDDLDIFKHSLKNLDIHIELEYNEQEFKVDFVNTKHTFQHLAFINIINNTTHPNSPLLLKQAGEFSFIFQEEQDIISIKIENVFHQQLLEKLFENISFNPEHCMRWHLI